jgi:hypothetical protein
MTHLQRYRTLLLASLFLFVQTSQAALLVDDCESPSAQNRLGGIWVTYTDPHSLILFPPKGFQYSPEGFKSAHCAKAEFEVKAGAPYPYVGFNTQFTARDLTAFEGVRFHAKGKGVWTFQLPTVASGTEYNHYSSPMILSEDWTLIELPFSKLTLTWGTQRPLDLQNVTGVQWSSSGRDGEKVHLSVDDIEFYEKKETTLTTKESNVILPAPKVNQVGYLPDAEKFFVVSEPHAKSGAAFRLLDDKDRSVFEGKLSKDVIDDLASTGEKVFRGDFTKFKIIGRYRVDLHGVKSAPFTIASDLYRPLYHDALRTFFINRCGVALDDPKTGLAHAACHIGDAPHADDPTTKGDFTGGWHNAGDYGKWTHMEAISCAWMMWLYEFKKGSDTNQTTLLAEARWGLEWMLKMQKDDGSVWHKVDPEQQFCFGTAPEKDVTPRRVSGGGSIDAGVF